jgi:hypothetical protein
MSLTEPTRHPSPVPAVGYAVTVVCDATLLYLVNVWPGWQVVSFPTDDTRQVLGLSTCRWSLAWSPTWFTWSGTRRW